MNSVTRFHLFKWAMAGALAVCMSSGMLMAQNAIAGKFTLPVQVHWGSATLPAGEYRFSIANASAPYTVNVHGTGANSKSAMIFSAGASESAPADRSELVLVRHGSTGAVRSLRLGPLGLVLRYSAPKREQSPLIAQAPQLIQRIPVLANGK